jgi:hypothetical protein
MQRRLLLLAVVAGLAGLFSNVGPTIAGPTPDIVVDTFCPACMTGANYYTTIHEAVAAASPAIRSSSAQVTYAEPTIAMNADLVKLLGPGTTPADDGVATVKVTPSTGIAIVHIAADSIAVRGLDIDGTLPTGFPGTTTGST